ncbi:hypothetical protein [Candidatus Nitronereus thalassa]|uniref:SGNH hydrolase-type esterase domain-containing protein n=1 Tax=Candidatus Nitronereus thalassa TaxID=3020898 RepID=A0ABU3KAY5_9BACT|nr:hypothetical protein [Candidatus Nitronereus thalassa]MDT7043575.1 hypothetical protein [Candidatus Nitronereus thalassa]
MLTDSLPAKPGPNRGGPTLSLKKRNATWYSLGLIMGVAGLGLLALNYPAGRFLLYGFALWLTLSLPVNLRIFIFSLGFCFILTEIGFRSYAMYLQAQYPGHSYEDILWEYDSLLGWKKTADLEVEFIRKKKRMRTQVKTNSLGLRDDEYTFQKPHGTGRILLLGDSVTVGLEVEKEEVIDTRLESRLSSEGQFEVINGGTRGYGTDQSYLFMKETGLRFQPDIVIYIFVPNDPENNVTIHKPNRTFGKSYFRLDHNGNLLLSGVPVPKVFEPFDQWIMSDPDLEAYYNQGLPKKSEQKQKTHDPQKALDHLKHDLSYFQTPGALKDLIKRNSLLTSVFTRLGLMTVNLPVNIPQRILDYQWKITEALVDAMNNKAQNAGAKFLVYEFTSDGKANAETTVLQKICERLEIPYLNSFHLFHEKTEGNKFRFRFPFDGHWNALGHDLAAQDIRRYLIEKGWVD